MVRDTHICGDLLVLETLRPWWLTGKHTWGIKGKPTYDSMNAKGRYKYEADYCDFGILHGFVQVVKLMGD